MKKLILGIIAVFLIEIGFITYTKLNSPEDLAAAAVNTAARVVDPGVNNEPVEPAFADEAAPLTGSIPNVQIARSQAVKGGNLVRRKAYWNRPGKAPYGALSARAFSHRPRVSAAPRPGYHTEVRRQYFGSMVVEVTYRVYEFRPRNSRTRKPALVA